MQVLKWTSKLKTLMEKYKTAHQESKIIIGILINLENQLAATVPLMQSAKPLWMSGFSDLPTLIIHKQIKARDEEIARLDDSIKSFEQIYKALNALLKDASAKVKLQSSLKSVSELEILQWIHDSFYSISKEINVQKQLFKDYVMGTISIEVLAERWDACEYVDFRLENELKTRLKYLK